jgi:DHA2 family multidrug resistance protein
MPDSPSLIPVATAGNPANAPDGAGQTRYMLLGLGLATWMEFYTYDGINLVLPDMAGSFGVSQDEASWILTSYSSALFLGVPLSIWLAGRLGHLRFLIGSIVVFAAASLACAMAPDFQTMLFWRAIEGLAGSGLTVWWRASVYMLLPRAQRGPSLMRISTMLYLATSVGLVFGGYVTDNYSWRFLLLLNLPFAAASIFLLLRHFPRVPPASDPRAAGVDRIGILLLAVALISLQVLLSRGDIDDWFGSPRMQVLAWTSAIAFTAFLGWQSSRHNTAPLFRVDLVKNRNVVAAIAIGIFTGIILSGSLYALPEYLRNVDPQPHSATRTGQIMCAYALAAAAIRPIVTWAIAKVGQRKAIVFALVMLIASMLLIARLMTAGTPDTAYIVPLILYAFCLAPLLSAVGGGTVSRVPQEAQLDAISIYMTFRQFGASLGVTLVTVVLSQRETLHSARLFDHLHATGPLVGNWVSTVARMITARGGYAPAQAQQMAVGLLDQEGIRQAATLAYADAFVFMAVIGLATLCLVPIMPATQVVKK